MEFPQTRELTADVFSQLNQGNRVTCAELMEELRPMIARRIRGRLNARLHRLFDTEEIYSTLTRRIDRYLLQHGVDIQTKAQFLALVNRITENAIIDKARAAQSLATMLQPLHAAQVSEKQRQDAITYEDSLVEDALEATTNTIDRSILWLWLTDTEFNTIAEILSMTPGAVRKRWQRLRHQLQEQLKGRPQ